MATDEIDSAYTTLLNLLDEAGHGDDCIFRCLNVNTCESDHGCPMCADDDGEA